MNDTKTPQQRLEGATKKLAKAATERDRFYALNSEAKRFLELHESPKAAAQ